MIIFRFRIFGNFQTSRRSDHPCAREIRMKVLAPLFVFINNKRNELSDGTITREGNLQCKRRGLTLNDVEISPTSSPLKLLLSSMSPRMAIVIRLRIAKSQFATQSSDNFEEKQIWNCLVRKELFI